MKFNLLDSSVIRKFLRLRRLVKDNFLVTIKTIICTVCDTIEIILNTIDDNKEKC